MILPSMLRQAAPANNGGIPMVITLLNPFVPTEENTAIDPVTVSPSLRPVPAQFTRSPVSTYVLDCVT